MSMATTNGNGFIISHEKDKPNSKCRKWELRVSLGIDPRTGRYRTKSRRFKGTYTEAKAALRSFIKEVEGNKVQGHTSYTFEQYCERYLERRRLGKEVAATTLKRQGCQFKCVCRHIGQAKLESITPQALDDMCIAMLKGDTLSGKPSSGSYVNQIHDNITLVFAQSVREGILTSNPCDRANPPKMDTKEKKAQFDKTNQWRKPEEGYLVQDESTRVIATHYGKRVEPSSLSRWWSEDRERYGLEGWTLHELRHSYLTLLALNGVHPKVMQELAGHYSSQITMDIYTHVNVDAKRKAVEAVSRVF